MRSYPSLIGNRYGKLTVIEQVESTPSSQRRWLCKCDCGGTHTVTTYNLTSGRSTNCGCKKSSDLTGQVFGKLTVLGRSDKRMPHGPRTYPMWECRCECGNITHRITAWIKNPDISMCKACADDYATEHARAKAGFVEGTQLTKLKIKTEKSDNLSGFRGVYLEPKTGKWRARIKLQGKIYNLGTYTNLEDAIKARRLGEEKYFESVLETANAAESAQLPPEHVEDMRGKDEKAE